MSLLNLGVLEVWDGTGRGTRLRINPAKARQIAHDLQIAADEADLQ